MAVSDNPLQRATIGVVARDTGQRYSSGGTNGLLQLAGTLAQLEPTLNGALQTYAQIKGQEEAEKARKDAITTSGAKLADAVRDGQIKPTQNPWYMQAYKREAAAVSARTQLNQLALDSASWEERNDPAKFADKWAQGLAAVAKNYSGADEDAGFSAVASQISQQTIASNQAQNVQRIEQERVQNASSLLATDISNVALAKGGSPTAADIAGPIQASRASWIGTGGSTEQWNKLVASAVTSAAYASKNPDLIDLLKDPSLSGDGKTSVYNIAGVADAAESDRYRISQAVQYAGQGRIRALQAHMQEVGQQGFTELDGRFGIDLYKGNVSSSQMLDYLVGTGKYTPQQAAYAVKAASQVLSGVAEADTARLSINGNDPQQAAAVLDLQGMAIREGWSPRLAAAVKEQVMSGQLKESSAQSILATAQATSNHFESEARADSRQAASDARRAAAEQDSKDVKSLRDTRQTALNIGARAARNVTVINKRGAYAPPALAKEAQAVAVNAAQGWLAKSPGDYAGAKTAAFDAAEAWGHSKINRRSAAPSSSRR